MARSLKRERSQDRRFQDIDDELEREETLLREDERKAWLRKIETEGYGRERGRSGEGTVDEDYRSETEFITDSEEEGTVDVEYDDIYRGMWTYRSGNRQYYGCFNGDAVFSNYRLIGNFADPDAHIVDGSGATVEGSGTDEMEGSGTVV